LIIDDLDVIFNQHQMHITHETQAFFIKNGLIAIHYREDLLRKDDVCSVDPEDYKPRAKRILQRMERYCEKGALGVGYFNEHPPSRMIIGDIPEGTAIQPKLRTLWTDEEYPEGTTCYKTIQLENYFEVDLTENRQLESCMPRGNVFVRWKVNQIDRQIKYLYKLNHGYITKRERKVNDLSFSQLEVLCSEYLRYTKEDYRIDHFVTPIGRSQKSTDIDGIGKKGVVLAQVSFSTNIEDILDKMSALSNYSSENTTLLYFGPKSNKGLATVNIEYVSIEYVFEKMKNTVLLDKL
jgi:hypothetical protein